MKSAMQKRKAAVAASDAIKAQFTKRLKVNTGAGSAAAAAAAPAPAPAPAFLGSAKSKQLTRRPSAPTPPPSPLPTIPETKDVKTQQEQQVPNTKLKIWVYGESTPRIVDRSAKIKTLATPFHGAVCNGRLVDGEELFGDRYYQTVYWLLPEKEPRKEFKLAVKTLTGKTVYLNVSNWDSAISLAEQFEKLEGVPVNQQRLIFSGKQLLHNQKRMLYQFGINGEGAEVHVVLRLRGGGGGSMSFGFADMEEMNMVKRLFARGPANHHRALKPGVGLGGVCLNRKCEVFGETVCFNAGFGEVDLVIDTAHCPVCEQQFRPDTCYFNRCRWRYAGMLLDGTLRFSKTEHVTEEDGYVTPSDAAVQDQKQWSHLKLFAETLRPDALWQDCALCAGLNLTASYEYVKLKECNHQFHRTCISKWHKLQPTCPLCSMCVNPVPEKAEENEQD